MKTNLKATVEKVTPELAAEWLLNNRSNRPIRKYLVAAYARDMATGTAWLLTGDPIRFAEDGSLVDGQHRLWAVIEANVPVEMMVVRGVAAAAQFVMDSGARRTTADSLRLLGESNAGALGAVARLYYRYENGLSLESRQYLTNAEIHAIVEANPDMRTAVSMSWRYYKGVDMPQSALSFSCLLLSRVDPTGCEVFFEQLSSKTGLNKGDPILALLNRLTEIRRTGRAASISGYMSLVLRAWNFWRKGEKVANLPLVRNGEAVEIPVPR